MPKRIAQLVILGLSIVLWSSGEINAISFILIFIALMLDLDFASSDL